MTNQDDLTEFETNILRELHGDKEKSLWGAAVGAALEHLYEGGYITLPFGGRLTNKGLKALARREAAEQEPRI